LSTNADGEARAERDAAAEPAISPAARVQRRLWGSDPRAWADLAEAHNVALFAAVLDAAGVGAGTRVLDIGCGSGLALVLAAQRGAVPAGIDISPGLLGIARERLPKADLRYGDMESLPFAAHAFDAVIGVSAFQFAGDPLRALGEAAWVLRPGGRLVASLFAAPERCQSTVVHEAMSTLILCSAGGARAKEAAGEAAVREVLVPALAQFEDSDTGVVSMDNTFRWVAASR